MLDRRALVVGGAISLALPAACLGKVLASESISERWLAFNKIETDEIWWRWDVVMGSPLVFPKKGAWQIDPVTKSTLFKRYEFPIREASHYIRSAKEPKKMTLLGPLRDHRSSDHGQTTLSATLSEVNSRSYFYFIDDAVR